VSKTPSTVTPNPKPQTPNPKPQTPNPKSQTPNPFPAGAHESDIAAAKRHARRRLQVCLERELFFDNLLVRIHVIIVMIRWTGLAPWEFEFPFPGSLTCTSEQGVGGELDGGRPPAPPRTKRHGKGVASPFFFFFITLKPRVE